MGDSALGPTSYSWLDSDTRVLAQNLEALTGLTVASYHGCYNVSSIEIEDAVGFPHDEHLPDCERESWPALEAPDTSAVLAQPDCGALAGDSAICLYTTSASGGEVGALGLDSGASCAVQALPSGLSGTSRSMAWAGGDLYFCENSYDILTRLSLTAADDWEVAYAYCSNVVSDGADLLLLPTHDAPYTVTNEALLRYDGGWVDTCDDHHEVLLNEEMSENMSVAACEDLLVTAWHAGSEVDLYTYPDLSWSLTLPLEDYYDWILGLALLPDGRLVVVDNFDTIWVFDVETGDVLDTWSLPVSITGLACAPVP